MKKFLCAALVAVMLLTLCACSNAGGDATTTVHTHAYTDGVTKEATCEAKGEKTFTCTCGDSYTEEIAQLEHSYVGGKCEHCDGAQENYKKLDEGRWVKNVIIDEEDAQQLEILTVSFKNSTVGCSVYYPYNPEWHEGATIIEVEGKQYVSAGFGFGGQITSFKEEGNLITVNVDGMGQQGTLVLERTAGNQLTVKEVTGTIIDSTITEFNAPGTVYDWKE